MSRRCYDCKARCEEADMVLIKADTLNGRAFICDPCHRAEVERITEHNRRIQARLAQEASNG